VERSDLLGDICTVYQPILDESARHCGEDEYDFEGWGGAILPHHRSNFEVLSGLSKNMEIETKKLKNFHPKTIEEQERLEDAKVGADGQQRDANLMK